MTTQALPIASPKNFGKFVFHLKILSLLVLGSSISLALLSQETKKIKINTLDQSANRYQFAYLNPAFTKGKIFFKNENFGSESKFNFNCLTSEMLFLNAQGDTLALANPENTSSVVMGLDTFYYLKNSFLQKITHYSVGPNLFIKKSMDYVDREKKGPYGTYSSTSSSNSAASFKNDNQIISYLSADENLIYIITAAFYLSDDLINFLTASKSGFYKMYPKFTHQLDAFFSGRQPNFSKMENLLEIVNYMENLSKQ